VVRSGCHDPGSASPQQPRSNQRLVVPTHRARAAGEGVSAFRLDLLYGKNTSVKVVDLGLINQTTTSSNGLQWGFVNYNEGSFNGLQLAAISYNKGTAGGLQWSGFNYAGTASGCSSRS
jgi:hypothetical protein